MRQFKCNIIAAAFMAVVAAPYAGALDHKGIVGDTNGPDRFILVADSQPVTICVDDADDSGVKIAVSNLSKDFGRVTGNDARVVSTPSGERLVVAGSLQSPLIKQLIRNGKIDGSQLEGKREKYVMTTVDDPFPGVKSALVIAGSDRRGAIYGVYELSEQIGVSPWYDWADVPVKHSDNLSIARGTYTAGEPAVTYRGLFLNDEAPCLTSWVKNTYGTNYGDHRFYARVFELLLRLRGNMMWPAMWGWSFYADDPENSRTADEMGVIMGTSHHEPMARNHQEWARHRKEYGAWDYNTNQKVIDRFFREGIERSRDNEDLITIGMRGDGDAPMGGEEGKDHEYVAQEKKNMQLLERIFRNQRKIIKDVTGKPASKRQQVWAIYKEVQRYYDMGLRVPDDVIMLLCDDNWGNVRRLPNAEERKHPGGWGMYYHVDYVGAPRNTKWINVTPIQGMWEQLGLTYDYGVDKLWILNVGDLKPMEYPITLFLDMAWNPKKYTAETLLDHTRDFCAQQFGADQADEAARILNLYSKYNGRVTPEMLDRHTYNLATGEWKQVADEYARLEAEALRQYLRLDPSARDAYKQLILYPVQAMSNLYDMYYAQAMNLKLHAEGNPDANMWADRVEADFARDAELMADYNKVMAGGKWNGMMIQKHIGYTSWNDAFPHDRMPEVRRIISPVDAVGGYVFTPSVGGYVSIEADHYNSASSSGSAKWTAVPHMGRTHGAMALMPYNQPVGDAVLTYKMQLPADVDSVDVHVVVKSTLAFANLDGHRYTVAFEGAPAVTVNYNKNLNENPENIYSVYYPTVARRVVESVVRMPVTRGSDSASTLVLSPLDPGIAFEKIVVDYGGYSPSCLFGTESPCSRAEAAKPVASTRPSIMTNPMLWADVPDPDVIRVGDDFYMVSTTMHLMPGCPVMKSKDLVNWEVVSYVFDRLSDTPNYDLDGGTVYGKGQWATSLRYHNGRFYLLFSPNDQPYKSYIYTAVDPAGKWELVSRTDHFHDSSLLFDDDGRVYVFSGSGRINLRELNPDLSGVKEGGINMTVIEPDSTERGLHEGSRVIKHNGKYYALVISWPHGKPRRQLCYRADKITGPYEKKVILQSEFGGFPYAGQGCIVDDAEGNWWGVIFQDRGGVGRVLTLEPCRWVDGWPMLGDENGCIPASIDKQISVEPSRGIVTSDDFDSEKLDINWQWNHNPVDNAWSLTERPGWMRLKTSRVVDNLFAAPNTLSQRMEGPACEASVKLDLSHMRDGDVAGFGAFNGHSGLMSVVMEGGRKHLVRHNAVVNFRRDSKVIDNVNNEELWRVELPGDELWLRVGGDFRPGTDMATFSYSTNGRDWQAAGPGFKMIYDYRRLFMGSRLAIYNYATKQTGGYVDVDKFDYKRMDKK